MDKPVLSVIMPNYNYGRYISKALGTILTQSYKPLEVIVVDDGSTDDSVSIIQTFMRRYPNLLLLQNEKNRGVHYSQDRGIEAATGAFMYSATSDDWVHPGFFERSMGLLSDNPQAGLCCSDTEFFDDPETVRMRLRLSKAPVYFPPKEAVKLLSNRPFSVIRSNTVIYKRSTIDEAGGFRHELKWLSDSFVQSIISFRHGFCYIPEVFTSFRRHETQYSNISGKWHLERELVSKMMKLVDSPEYRDVRPMFRKSARFSDLPWETFSVAVNEKRWGYFSIRLLCFALFDKLIKRNIKQLLAVIKKKYRGWSVDTAFRYLPIAAEIKRSGIKDPSILDVGSGSLGITPYLKMKVTGADISFDGPVPELLRPVKFDGINLPFRDREFDFVISVDMLEHVLPEQRDHMLKELIRVSRRRLFLAAPFGKYSELQDAALQKFYNDVWGKSFKFFDEHVKNGLPDREWAAKAIAELCRKSGRSFDIKVKKNLNLKFRYLMMRWSFGRNRILNYMDNLIALLPFVWRIVNFGKCYRLIFTVNFPDNDAV